MLNLTENIVVRVLVVLLNSSPRKSICESIPDTKLFLYYISNSRQTLTLAGESFNERRTSLSHWCLFTRERFAAYTNHLNHD